MASAAAALAALAAVGVGSAGGPPRTGTGAGGGAPGLALPALPANRALPVPRPEAGLRALAPPRLGSFADRRWWSAALAVRHWPGRAGFTLALDLRGRPAVAVFVYHQVAPARWPLRNGPDFITPARLAAEFAFFRAHHVATLTPAQFVAFLDGRGRVAPGSVFLTFDNGLEGVYRYAYPLARRDRMHITVFLIGARVHDRWRGGDKFLAWDQVRRMVRSGLVGVESETYDLHTIETIARDRFGPAVERRWETYPHGHEEALGAYARRLRYAFTEQRAVFWRHLHTTPTLLVWPFSTYNQVAEREAQAAGYVAAFAVYPGVVTPGARPDRFALPRNPATFMWDDVPAEYGALRGGALQLAWPPNSPAALVAATPRPRSRSAVSDRA